MPLTGRGVYSRKRLVENAKTFDMKSLRKWGFFEKGAGISWTSSWTSNGEPWGEVNYWREDCHGMPLFLWFSYNVKKDGEEWHPVKYPVVIESTRCHFGGLRHWFVCPLAVDGRPCKRRCRCLYMHDSGYFGCRECLRLTYYSRRKHRDKFWEAFGKHRDFLEEMGKKFDPPRGRKAKERRRRRIAAADWGMEHGLDGLPLLW